MDISKDGEILLSIIKPVVLHLWDTNTGEIKTKIPITEEVSLSPLSLSPLSLPNEVIATRV